MRVEANDECFALAIQVKSEKWGSMFVDVRPTDQLVGGSVIQCKIEQNESLVSMKIHVKCAHMHALCASMRV